MIQIVNIYIIAVKGLKFEYNDMCIDAGSNGCYEHNSNKRFKKNLNIFTVIPLYVYFSNVIDDLLVKSIDQCNFFIIWYICISKYPTEYNIYMFIAYILGFKKNLLKTVTLQE